MPDVAKLKKKAAELELKKQFDKALAVYVEILASYKGSKEEVDVALLNRVGDIYLKQGNVADAVTYYERAVDHYVDNGFFNNAIALCNKILRASPGRATIYYKLGKISAHKGFKSDAKANYLEYADRMQRSGKIDEAFRALKEFADLCPDQDDIRLMLADQLTRQKRGVEAVEQLQLLYERYVQEGRNTEAAATVQRMKAIDPMAVPRAPGAAPRRNTSELVFLDLGDGTSDTPPPPAAPPAPAAPPPVEIPPAVLDGLTRAAELPAPTEPAAGSLLEGLQTTGFDDGSYAGAGRMVDLEPTNLGGGAVAGAPAGADEGLLDFDMSNLGGLEEPAAGRDDSIGGDLDLIMPEDEPSAPPAAARAAPEPALEDDIPLMDLELPVPGEAMAGITGQGAPAGFEMLDLDETEHTEPVEQTEQPGRSPAPPEPPRAPSPPAAAGRRAPYVGRVKGKPEPLGETSISPAMGFDAPPLIEPLAAATLDAAHSVESLQAMVTAAPENHTLRRRLAEMMLDSGDREGGLRELETAMVGFERSEDLDSAASLADEVVRLNPDTLRYHQKRVEYAFRRNERGRLIEAYLELADALFRAGQMDKSRAIYQRVLDLAPGDARAQAALESFPATTPEPAALPPTSSKARPGAAPSRAAPARPAPRAAAPTARDEEFVNLGEWLRGDEAPKDTRMVVTEQEPSGDEEADFQDMLRKFKQGVAENVEEEDHQAHYDLGVAYKEMGLTDEAIAEFQKALRAPSNRVPAYEALGQCFMEKEQYPMAATILSRALHEKGVSDDQLVGVLYLLGRCAEERGQNDLAVEFYQRVFVVDIQFRDVGDRLAALESALS